MPVYLLSDELVFPHPGMATQEGLLAAGGDLSPERLLLAYQNGIFPWFSEGDPILWWSPDPRLILYPDELRVSRSLRRTIRRGKFKITLDADFKLVIKHCAQTRNAKRMGTWITDEMADAYIRLHHLGYAHSVESWHEGQLVGGLYGIFLGRCFFGESMFSSMSDASKVALVHLRDYLQARGLDFIDCQLPTDHLVRLGACEVARESFLRQLGQSLKHHNTITGKWA